MSVENRHQKPGSWEVTLISETPPSTIDALARDPDVPTERGWFGHIVITPTHVDSSALSDANMLSLSRYTGIFRSLERAEGGVTSIGGPGLVSWLGDENGKGPVIGASATFPNAIEFTAADAATLSDWITAIIPPSLTIGTVTESINAITSTLPTLGTLVAVSQTPRQFMEETLLPYFNVEYRVNPDGTIDVGPGCDEEATLLALSQSDASVSFRGATLLNAQDATGTGTLDSTTNPYIIAGQQFLAGEYHSYQSFFEFDTSTIPDTATIVDVELHVFGDTASASTDEFDLEAYAYDFGASITTADFRTKAQLTANVILARRSSSAWSTSGYNVLSSTEAFPGAINLTGNTRIVIASSRQRLGSTPTGTEYVYGEFVEQAGASEDPRLFITYHHNNGLFTCTPTAMAVRKKSGRDPIVNGLATQNLSVSEDAEDYRTQISIAARADDFTIGTYPSAVSLPTTYKDLNGNDVDMSEIIDAPEILEELAQSLADEYAAQGPNDRRTTPLTTDEYDIEGFVHPGDYVYIHDPVRGLFDSANLVFFRGEATHPAKLRLYSLTWPIRQGMGVYYRDKNGLYTDLTEWVQWEDGTGGADSTGAEGMPDLVRKAEIFNRTTKGIR